MLQGFGEEYDDSEDTVEVLGKLAFYVFANTLGSQFMEEVTSLEEVVCTCMCVCVCV